MKKTKKLLSFAFMLSTLLCFTLALNTLAYAENPTISSEYSISSSVATLDENTVTFTETGSATLTIPVSNYVPADGGYVSFAYKASDVNSLELKVVYVDSDGETTGTLTVANCLTGWNVTKENYSSIGLTIITAKIESYISSYSEITSFIFGINANADAVVTISNITITADGKHGIELPANTVSNMTVSSSAGATITANNETGYQTVTYSTSPGWHTFDFTVSNFDQASEYNSLKLVFYASADFTLWIGSGSGDTGHVPYAGGKEHVVRIDLTSSGTFGVLGDSFTVKMYIDPSATVTSEKTIEFRSISVEIPPKNVVSDLTTNNSAATITKDENTGYQTLSFNYVAAYYTYNFTVSNFDQTSDARLLKIVMCPKLTISGMRIDIGSAHTSYASYEGGKEHVISLDLSSDGIFGTIGNSFTVMMYIDPTGYSFEGTQSIEFRSISVELVPDISSSSKVANISKDKDTGYNIVKYAEATGWYTFDFTVNNFDQSSDATNLKIVFYPTVTIDKLRVDIGAGNTGYASYEGGKEHVLKIDLSADSAYGELGSTFTASMWIDPDATVTSEKTIEFRSISIVKAGISVEDVELKDGEVFIGWNYDGKLYSSDYDTSLFDESVTAVTLNFNMVAGASMRVDNPSGLRFMSLIDTAVYNEIVELAGAENVVLGTRILRYNTDKTYMLDVVVGEGTTFAYNETLTGYTGVVVGISEENYNVEYEGRGYIEIIFADKTESVKIYANGNDNKRTVSEVARSCYESGDLSDEEKTVLEQYFN